MQTVLSLREDLKCKVQTFWK